MKETSIDRRGRPRSICTPPGSPSSPLPAEAYELAAEKPGAAAPTLLLLSVSLLLLLALSSKSTLPSPAGSDPAGKQFFQLGHTGPAWN